MNDLKQEMKDLEIVKILKNDLNNERYRFLNDKSKALLLKALNDYAFEIDNDIRRHNNNVDLLEDMDIPSEKIVLPKSECTNLKYPFEDALAGVPFDVQIVYLKDLVDMYVRGNSHDYGFTDLELQVLLKSLKKYAHSMNEMIIKSKNDKEIVGLKEDNHYVPLTQQQMRDSFFSSFMKKQNSSIKK